MVTPLYELINARWSSLFLDVESNTGRNCIGLIIQRHISNTRRNLQIKAKKSNTRELSEGIPHNGSRGGGEYDFVIIASVPTNPNQTVSVPLMSVITQYGPDPLQRISLTVLRTCIKADLPGLQKFDLVYHHKHPVSYTQTLLRDAQLHAALMDSRRQPLSYAVLDIIESSSPAYVETDNFEEDIVHTTTLDPIPAIHRGRKKRNPSRSPSYTARTKKQRSDQNSACQGENALVTDMPASDNGGGENISTLADHFKRGASLNPQMQEPEPHIEPSIETDLPPVSDTQPLPQTVTQFKNMEGLPFLDTDGRDFKVEKCIVEDFSLDKKMKDDDEDGEEEEFGKELDAEEKVSQDLLGIIRSRQVTEHLSHENWNACCEFLLHDPEGTSPEDTFKIKGIKTPVLPFQAFGAYMCIFKLEVQSGVWLADTMGLGKTLMFLVVRAIHRAILLCRLDILKSRDSDTADRYLLRGTTADP
jgi:hypothetical protein